MNRYKTETLFLWMGICSLAAYGCQPQRLDTNGLVQTHTGEAALTVQFDGMNSAHAIRYEISALDIAPPISGLLSVVNNTLSGTIQNIPAGIDRQIRIEVIDDQLQLVCEATESFEVKTNDTAQVQLTLHCSEDDIGNVEIGGSFNKAPLIHSMFSSKQQARSGESVSISVSATDPDQDVLAFEWSASSGDFDDVLSAATEYRPDGSEGTVTLTARVRDAEGGEVQDSLSLRVDGVVCPVVDCADPAICGLVDDGCGNPIQCPPCVTMGVCAPSGNSGDEIVCPLHLVRENDSDPEAAAIQFEITRPDVRVDFVGFSCPAERVIAGNRVTVDACAGDLGSPALVSGHSINLRTTADTTRVIMNHNTDPSLAISSAHQSGGVVVGESEFARMVFKLNTSIPVSESQEVSLHGIIAVDANALVLGHELKEDTVVTKTVLALP